MNITEFKSVIPIFSNNVITAYKKYPLNLCGSSDLFRQYS